MPTLIMPKEAAVRKFHPAVWCGAIALAGLVTGATIRAQSAPVVTVDQVNRWMTELSNPIATF
jgi:hypothetical protein